MRENQTYWSSANTECVADYRIAPLSRMPKIHKDTSSARDRRRAEEPGEKTSYQNGLDIFCGRRSKRHDRGNEKRDQDGPFPPIDFAQRSE